MRNILKVLLGAALCLPVVALAHTGAGSVTGFFSGFAHPLMGVDHLLAMVAVGLWAAQIGGAARWQVPTAFVTLMLLGGALGMSGFSLPYIESGVVGSVMLLGLLIAVSCRPSNAVSMAIVSFFALFHGHAHGAEMPVLLGAIAYSCGFALTTASLHAVGLALGGAVRGGGHDRLTRLAGAGIALAGAWLAVA
ncbi:MAG TPA: HupE/UreJ family protein [Methylophilaceae bacterium]|nr:HupE/UreJ family protein [Methylophilaceae bacterium]HQR59950.1 HupE/UreJ family protein [Methylophilaceae bacterium]